MQMKDNNVVIKIQTSWKTERRQPTGPTILYFA